MKPKLKQILIIGVLIGTIVLSVQFTLSYFQDTEKSENNAFSAGTLDLNFEGNSDAVWKAENWLPGDEVSGELELKNDGSLPIESLLMSVEIEELGD